MYMLYAAVVAYFKPEMAPALPTQLIDIPGREMARRVIQVMLPPLLLILVVLGSIFAGVATPTEAGSMGVLGALVLAAFTRRLRIGMLVQALRAAAELTTVVIILLLGATLFSLVFIGLDGDAIVEEILLSLPGGIVSLLIFVNLLVFILGFFLDYFEIAFIVVPLMAPAILQLGYRGMGGTELLVWFGVMIGMNLQTSFLTPPFGFSLFYLRGIAPPEVTTTKIYRGVVPFIGIQLVGLLLIILFPGLVTWVLR